MADRQLTLPEVVRPDRRLGRHVRHDPRSLRYLVQPRGARAVTPRTVFHPRRIPLLDQNAPIAVGSCTCSSAAGVLGSSPFYETLPAELQRTLADPVRAQAWAVELYREVTRLDPFEGAYEPDDTGSDGLTVAKVLTARGLIAGYEHITSVDAAHAAIQRAPFFAGTMWWSGQEAPNSQGIVTATGRPLGGHQYQCFGYETGRDLWWWWQTWGPGFGVEPPDPAIAAAVPGAGAFAMTSATFAKLLREQGDATLFVPRTAPAPQPAPEPAESEPPAEVDAWAERTAASRWRAKRDRAAASAYLEWRTAP